MQVYFKEAKLDEFQLCFNLLYFHTLFCKVKHDISNVVDEMRYEKREDEINDYAEWFEEQVFEDMTSDKLKKTFFYNDILHFISNKIEEKVNIWINVEMKCNGPKGFMDLEFFDCTILPQCWQLAIEKMTPLETYINKVTTIEDKIMACKQFRTEMADVMISCFPHTEAALKLRETLKNRILQVVNNTD